MISEQELRRKLDQLQEQLGRVLERTTDADVQADIQRAEAIVEEIRSSVPAGEKKYSIMELEGVGKEFWSKIDAEEYIRKERESWD